MARIDDLRRLAAEIEASAQSGDDPQLSAKSLDLLREAVDEHALLAVEDSAGAAPFRIVVRDALNREEITVALAKNLTIAKAIFRAAAKRYGDQAVRLYEGTRIIEETLR